MIGTGQAQYDYRLDDGGAAYLCWDPVEAPEEPAHEGEEEPEEASS